MRVALVAALLVLAGPAGADPISAAILTFIGFEATAVAVSTVTFGLTLAASIGMNLLKNALFGGGSSVASAGSSGKIQTGGAVARSFPLATAVADHQPVYVGTFGSEGKTPNAYLAMVFALWDLPTPTLSEVWVNGTKTTWSMGGTSGVNGIPVPEFTKNGVEHLWVRFYDGTQTTADGRMTALFGGAANAYGADMIGTGITYATVICRFNRDLFSGGMPSFKFVTSGMKWYDPRKDSTVGGSGSQRWATPTTWASSDNPIVQTYNIMRGVRFSGSWFFGGQTISSAQLPLSSWMAGMNASDALVSAPGGGTEKFAVCNGGVSLSSLPADVITQVLGTTAGKLAEVNGTFKVAVGSPAASTFTLTDAGIISTKPRSFVPVKPWEATVNHVTARYVEPAEGWNAKDAPVLESASLEATDGRRNSVALDMPFVTVNSQAQRLMWVAREESRRARTHEIVLPPTALSVEVMDTISWTSTREGYTNKAFRVASLQDHSNLMTSLRLEEVDPADYAPPTSLLVVPRPPVVVAPTPHAVSGWSVTAVTLTGEGSRAAPALRISWTGEDQDDVDGVYYEVRLFGGAVVSSGVAPDVTADAFNITAGILSATAYEVRGKFRSGAGLATEWTAWTYVVSNDVRVSADDIGSGAIAPAALHGVLTQYFDGVNQRLDQLRQDAEGYALGTLSFFNEADVARGEDRAALIAQTSDMRAVIETLLLVKVGAGGASSLRLDSVEARVSSTEAGVSALAESLTTVTAAVQGITAEGILQFVNVAAPGGALAAVQMQVTAQGAGGPVVSTGMKMVANSDGTSRALFDTGELVVADGTDSFVVFDTVGRTFTLYNSAGQRSVVFDSNAGNLDFIQNV